MGTPLSLEEIRAAPKVLLHDHLDGGVRPTTVIDLAAEQGYDALPTTDPHALAAWFVEGAARRSLPRYLEPFEHTVGVMQTRDALTRVAAECAEDLRDDGIVYAEVRFAPELHLSGGLTPTEVVHAVRDGFDAVVGRPGPLGNTISIGLLLTAMRTAANSSEIAEMALALRERDVVGFDIAGSEAGHPPTRHLDAFRTIARGNHHITIHAGEAFGLPSIWEAIQLCGAERLGHGVRIVDDIEVGDDGAVRLGELASFVRDRRVPLEMCPTSNVHTGVVDDLADHPIGLLTRLRFRVTVNTDNRLMSDVTLSEEFHGLSRAFGYGWSDLQWFTVNAMKSAFWPFDKRLRLINETIKPGYAAMKARSVDAG